MDKFSAINNPESLRLGEDSTRYSLTTREENRTAALLLAQQATRKLDIFTPDMETFIYDTDDFAQAVTRFALSSQHARMRILTLDIDPAVKYGHRLIEVSRKLSTYIEIKHAHEDYRSALDCYLLVDDSGLLQRTVASRFEGICSMHQPVEVRRLREQFNDMWERSHQTPEFRRLHL